MRKVTSKYGNLGEADLKKYPLDNRTRCNVCNFCNGIDGNRQMFRDPLDKTGGHICNKCRPGYGEDKDFKGEEWYRDAIEQSKNSVDGQRSYDEMVEDLISTWEREQGS